MWIQYSFLFSFLCYSSSTHLQLFSLNSIFPNSIQKCSSISHPNKEINKFPNTMPPYRYWPMELFQNPAFLNSSYLFSHSVRASLHLHYFTLQPTPSWYLVETLLGKIPTSVTSMLPTQWATIVLFLICQIISALLRTFSYVDHSHYITSHFSLP